MFNMSEVLSQKSQWFWLPHLIKKFYMRSDTTRQARLAAPVILTGYDITRGHIRSVSNKGCLAVFAQLRGTTECIIQGEKLILRPDTIVLLDSQHDVSQIVRTSSTFRSIAVEFHWSDCTFAAINPSQPMKAWRAINQTTAANWRHDLQAEIPTILSRQHAQKILPLLESASRSWWTGQAGRFEATACIANICAQLIRWFQTESPRINTITEHDHINRAVELLRSNHGHGMNVDSLATEAGLSRSHFSRIFTDLYGCSPGAFIRRIRIESVAERLRNGAQAEDIARDMGWRDRNSMVQYITRATNIPWAQWLSLHKEH